MADPHSPRIAELESTVSHLEQREKRLRKVISSAWISRDHRREAREELESILNKSDEAEHELISLDSHNTADEAQPSPERAIACRQPRSLLSRRFSRRNNKGH